MIVFLYGKEKFLLFQRYLELKESFHKKNDQATLIEFDASEDFDSREFSRNIAEGAGLFSQKKIIIVKDAFSLPGASQKVFWEALADRNVSENKELFLLIVELHSNPTKSKLFDFLKENSKSQEFKNLAGDKLEKWINFQITKKSKGAVGIKREAVNKIVALAGNDLWMLDGLISNLVNYCENVIEPKDVEIFGSEKFDSKIFDLVDALGARNISKALSIKQRLISQGENEFLIFSMIVSQLRNLLKVNDGFKKGMQPASISSSLGMHPFVVKKTISQLQNYDEKKLKSAFELASRLDLEAKTGELEMKDALDYLIVKM